MSEKTFGVMLDMSRNAVMKPSALKKLIDYLSAFGYNTVQLYTEDTYKVDGEPYFGYLRGGYTKDEIREIDSHCKQKGIELIPCIQTLAHLKTIFRWQPYFDVNDFDDVLLIDEPRTYQLIENMFLTIKDSFSSRKIHIGMDEAHMVGLGRYRDKHGIVDRYDLLKRHLDKVVEIAKKYGFKPMMWSDMFFRMANGGEYYPAKINLPQNAIDGVPDVSLVYWDYYHTKKDDYRKMIKAHEKFGKDIWFAGGAWTWTGFTPTNKFTLQSMKPAMDVCRERGVENIFLTMWGDGGKECSFFALLPSLFYVKRYYDGISDRKQIAKEFEEITGESFEKMMRLDEPNMVGGNKEGFRNQSKYMLYNDPFLGIFDTICKDEVPSQYKKIARKLSSYAKQSKNFGYVFDTLSKLCKVLALKYDLGVRTRAIYKSEKRDELPMLINDFKKTESAIKSFYKAFNDLWHCENKPNGFEVHEARLGGLLLRMQSCRKKLQAYASGKIDSISELDETLLDFWGNGEEISKEPPNYNNWGLNVSVNPIN